MFVKTNQRHSIVIPLSSSARFMLMSSNSAECNAEISPEIENTRSVSTLSNYFYYYYCYIQFLFDKSTLLKLLHATLRLLLTVTVTEALVLCPLLKNRGCITESIRILVPVNRIKQKCFQITMKQIHRSQQFQLRRQPVPCSLCSNREGSHNEAHSVDRSGILATDVRCIGVCPRSRF